MKKILIISAAWMSFVFTSCKKNFLDKNPNDQIASETFWNTEADVKMGLTGIYHVMRDRTTFNHGRMLWDGLTDIAYTKQYPSIAPGIIEPTSGSIVANVYNDCYVGISRANIFLTNADKAPMADANRTMYKAEAYFLRAYFYFILTEFYGGVPLYTTPVTIAESQVKQSTKEVVVAQILQDVEKAVAGLPNTAYTGHAVKGSALALKAQVLMHNNKWAESAAAANEIITSAKFSLYNDYQKLFLTEGQENNPEIIFSVRFLKPDAPMITNNDHNPDLIGAHGHSLSALKKFVDEFEATDGLPISQSPLYNPANYKLNRDPRLKYNVRDENEKMIVNGAPYNGESWTTPYSIEKYVNWKNAPYSFETRSDQDYIIFRYAQVLVMYAEAKNEATGPDASVYAAINAVRARPTVNMPPLPAGLDKDAMRARIRHERIVELGMEGLRYWDLKRWKIAETVIPTVVDPSGIKRVFNPAKHYLFPFTQSERDRNPNLDQNPGYN